MNLIHRRTTRNKICLGPSVVTDFLVGVPHTDQTAGYNGQIYNSAVYCDGSVAMIPTSTINRSWGVAHFDGVSSG